MYGTEQLTKKVTLENKIEIRKESRWKRNEHYTDTRMKRRRDRFKTVIKLKTKEQGTCTKPTEDEN